MRRATAWLPWSLVGIYVLAGAANVHYRGQVNQLPAFGDNGLILSVVSAFALVGALIVSRRPRQPVGWLLLFFAITAMIDSLSDAYALVALAGSPGDPPVVGVMAAWVSEWAGQLALVVGFVLLPLVYPDGRLPSSRWRPLLWAAVALAVTAVTLRATTGRLVGRVRPAGEDPIVVYDVANPLAVSWVDPLADQPQAVFWPLFAVVFLMTIAAVWVRFRRSRGVERQQMKWFVFATAVALLGLLGFIASNALIDGPPVNPFVVWMLTLAGFPIAVGVAVLRYRLYDIDRIVSRTVTYGLVVAAMGGLYVAGVVGLGAAVAGMTGEQGGDLVVAASVLGVAALFRPVRSRVQTAVDRRFNRTGYQARQAVDAFTEGLREEVDARAIQRDLVATATTLVQPDHLSVWIPDRRAEP
jgi:hypothetical protein